MIKCYFLPAVIAGMSLANVDAVGQTDASTTTRATNTLSRMSQSNASATDMIWMMPPSHEHKVDGNPYWDEHWSASSVLLYDNPKLHEGYYTRYDISRDEFEFDVRGQIKVVQGRLIKNVVWIDSITQRASLLVNAKDYKLDGVPLVGFLEVLVDGDPQLVKRVELHVLKPNYNVAMSTGSKNTKITKDDKFYYSSGGEIFEIESRKSLEPLFGEHSDQMAAFIKEQKLKVSRETDLLRIFEHLATLKPQGSK